MTLTRSLIVVSFLLLAVACNRNGTTSSTDAPTAHAATQTPQAAEGETETKTPISVEDVPTDDIEVPPATVPELGTTLEVSEEEWRDRLTKKQYRILRDAGTEFAGTGVYNKFDADGTYHCSACNNPLFSSETKFDSKTGWPSFYDPIQEGRVESRPDNSHGMSRTEVLCGHCGGHLGHVFRDGPDPTGLRYCINSVSLYFRPDGESE